MSRDSTLKFRVRCSQDPDKLRITDPYEYFRSLDDATEWARNAMRAGRFKRLVIQDMGGDDGQWSVVDVIVAPSPDRSV